MYVLSTFKEHEDWVSYNLRKIREMCWKESIFYLASSLYRSKSVGFNILNEGC